MDARAPRPGSSFSFGSGGYGGGMHRSADYEADKLERERQLKEREKQLGGARPNLIPDRDRAKANELELERERQAIFEERRMREQGEKERQARLARERERQQQIQRERDQARMHEAEQKPDVRRPYGSVEAKPFQPPRQSSAAYGDIYQPRPAPSSAAPPAAEPKYTRHIEVLNPGSQPQPYPSEPPAAKAPPPVAAAAPAPPPAPTPQPAPAPPARERQAAATQPPYQYNPKPDTREYTYTPRDNKRPRMDTAVEEAAPSNRRATATRKRAKKEEPKEEKKDLSALTVAVKKWPEVKSQPVQDYLKTIRDLRHVVSRVVYGGNEWSLARTRFTQPDYEGGLVIVRMSGACLGSRWKVRGEPGWEEASPTGGEGAEVGLEWGPKGKAREERRIWGTDVYTDDSDLGLVLIHAGWIRWGGPETRSDSDLINITVRVVPSLIRYYATERNGVITRGWGNGHDGGSIVVEDVERVKVSYSVA